MALLANEPYDLAVIGAGAAGLIGAKFAASIGARVALIDRGPIGGDCTWTGCVPSKALLRAARAAHEMRTAARFGVSATAWQVDWPAVSKYLHDKIDEIYQPTTPESLEALGIDVYLGNASFASPSQIQVDGHGVITPRKVLVCVGAKATLPPIPGIETVAPLTYHNLFHLKALPTSLTVIGAGPIGLEMAQAFQRLGAQVTLIDQAIFAREEPEVQAFMAKHLTSEGVRIVSGVVAALSMSDGQIVAEVAGQSIRSEQLLIATGRKPNLDGLQLDLAGIQSTANGIAVDEALQTSNPNVYACGDCIGSYQFSHFAGWQGFQAVRTALLPGKGSSTSHVVPWCTFTDPEVARVGPLEAEARAQYGDRLGVRTLPMTSVDRATCDGDVGFLKVLHVGFQIIGATVVSEHAGELINEIAVAMKAGIGLDRVAGTIHAYPTYSTGFQLVASQIANDVFFQGSIGKLALKVSGLPKGPTQNHA